MEQRPVCVKKQEDKSDEPSEIHAVSFPNEQKFADYLADSEMRQSSDSRDKIIARTENLSGCDLKICYE